MFGPGSVLASKRGRIDCVYLDCSFAHPKFVFPSREQATASIIEIIQKNAGHQVLLGLDTFGKEELLLTLAKHFATKVVVSQSKLQLLSVLQLPLELVHALQ